MSAEIVAYATSKGTIQPDSPATTSVRVTNTGPEDSTLWVSYSVQDPTGRWHDGSATSNQRTCPSRTVNSAEPCPRKRWTVARSRQNTPMARLLRGAHQGARRPSSITGFFRYEPPDFESEIDVEIYNDSSRRVLFTTYAGGEQAHTETTELPFDLTQDFHDYAFSYDEDSITFLVDGEPMKELEGGLPDKPMKLYVNTSFPQWLSGEESDLDRHVYVNWIGHQ